MRNYNDFTKDIIALPIVYIGVVKKYKKYKEIIIIRSNYLKNEVGFIKECELIGKNSAVMQRFMQNVKKNGL